MYAATAYLAAAAAMTAVDSWNDIADRRERQREARAEIYAPVSQVKWQIDGDRLLIFVAVSRKLEPCVVAEGAPITLVARWRDSSGQRFRSYPAFAPGGRTVDGAPLVLEGEEFVVGPFVIEDKPEVIAAISSVAIRLPCQFESGVTRTATIGPVVRP